MAKRRVGVYGDFGGLQKVTTSRGSSLKDAKDCNNVTRVDGGKLEPRLGEQVIAILAMQSANGILASGLPTAVGYHQAATACNPILILPCNFIGIYHLFRRAPVNT